MTPSDLVHLVVAGVCAMVGAVLLAAGGWLGGLGLLGVSGWLVFRLARDYR